MPPGRPLLRALPSVFVGVLVVVAAAAQSGPANPFRRLLPARQTAASVAASVPDLASPASVNGATCRALTPTASIGRPPDAIAWQPDAVTGTANGLLVAVEDFSGAAVTLTAQVRYFDPGALPGDPTLAAFPLTRCTLTASGLGPEMLAVPLDRPIVVRELAGGGVTLTAAFGLHSAQPSPVQDPIDPDGPLSYRPAHWQAGALGFVPLPGPNPVLAHEVCGEASGAGGLWVVAQAIRSDEVVGTGTAELIQTFTCPVTVTADWLELAIASPPGGTGPLEISLLDLSGSFDPPVPLPVTITATTLDAAALSPPVWGATAPFAAPVQIEAGTRVGLRIVTNGQWSLGAVHAPGGSGFPGGELFVLDDLVGAYVPAADLDLSFRLIGSPITVTAELPPTCDASPLSIAPTGTATFPIPPDRVVVQPLAIRGTDFGPGLKTAIGRASWHWENPNPTTVPAEVDFVFAPPGSPPEPDMISLRALGPVTRTCDPCPGGWDQATFDVPLVHRTVTGVAQGGDDELVLRLTGVGTWTAAVGYDENSPATFTPALYRDAGGPWQPLPGLHPVVSHVICPTTQTADPELYVAQQLVRGGVLLSPTATAGVLQSFRVPVPTELRWPELALARRVSPTGTAMPSRLMAPGPCTCTADPDLGVTLATTQWGPFDHPTGTATSARFLPGSEWPTSVTLTPGVDYWIHVTPTADWDLAAADASTYTEGRLYRSAAPGAPFVEETDRDLAFRLIGVPRALMADNPTITCCWATTFTGVTTTADFRGGGGGGGAGGLLRSYSQVVTPTATVSLGSLRLPLGSDGSGVTVTVRLGFTEPGPGGMEIPSSLTYPLVIATVTASGGDMRWSSAAFDRPLVLRGFHAATTTAMPPVAIEVSGPTDTAEPLGRPKLALGAVTACACPVVTAREGGSWSPLPGLALGHVLDPVTAVPELALDLGVAAASLDTRGVTITGEVLQRFRVPVACAAEWIELAVPEGQEEAVTITVEIVDPAGMPLPPPPGVAVPTGTASFPLRHRPGMALGSAWHATGQAPTGTATILVPGREYVVRAVMPMTWRVATGVTATAEFGGAFTRPPGSQSWTQLEGPLAFRLIASALETVDAPAPARPIVMMLSAEPQPFSHETSLRWSGGIGRMTVEIFDARGRRVRAVRDAGAAARGAWTWRGEDDAGRRVAAGVYFARVTPTTGPALRKRVVFLR